MVKCIDCGYLTVRHTFERNLVEAEGTIRFGENWPVQQKTNICLYERRPLCFVMARRIGNKDGDYSALEFKDVINELIECEYFTRWQQGFTPKEHREILDRQQLLQWQDKREEKDRQFRERESNSNKRYRIIELVFVVITIVVVLAVAFIEREGQPTINIITPNPSEVTIERQP